MIRLLPILILLISFSATASTRPTPIPGERASEFIHRWEFWLSELPESFKGWEGMQSIESLIVAEHGSLSSLTAYPSREENWNSTVALMNNFPTLISKIHLAAEYTEIAMPISSFSLTSKTTESIPASIIQLPHLSFIRSQSKLLVADMILASREKDQSRIIVNAKSLTKMQAHCNQINAAIEHLLSIAATSMFCDSILEEHIDLSHFSENEIRELDNCLVDQSAPFINTQWLQTEKFMVLDPMFWLYEESTDGVLTLERVSSLLELEGSVDPDLTEEDPRDAAVRIESFGTLEDQVSFIEEYFQLLAIDLQTPLHELPFFSSTQFHESQAADNAPVEKLNTRYLPARAQIATYSKVYSQSTSSNTRLNATRLLLAAHRHKLTHGQFPETLEDFDPKILTFTPIDLFTGQPLNYDILVDKPLIYSNGTDRDDDNAAPAESHEFIPLDELHEILKSDPASIDGDWILYPATRD